LKGGSFKWINEAEKSFELMKQKVTNAHIFSLLDFLKKFLNLNVICLMLEPMLFLAKRVSLLLFIARSSAIHRENI
jgi:hypothetical protein